MTVLLITTLAFNFKNKLKRQPVFSSAPPLQQAHWKWVGMDLTAPHSVLLLGPSRGCQLTPAARNCRGMGRFASVLRCLLIAEDLRDPGVWSCTRTSSTGVLLPRSLQWCSSTEHVHPAFAEAAFFQALPITPSAPSLPHPHLPYLLAPFSAFSPNQLLKLPLSHPALRACSS